MTKERGANYTHDTIIIGTGIGGLTAGAYLARKGRKVLLCEQHTKPGGCFNSFKYKGYTFDGGIQGCESAGMLIPMLEQLGIRDRIKLTTGSPSVATPDVFVKYSNYKELADFFVELEKYYPDDIKGLKQIRKEIIKLGRTMKYILQAPNPLFQKSIFHFFFKCMIWFFRYGRCFIDFPHFIRLMNKPVEDYLLPKMKNPRPVKLLVQALYNGSSASFAIPFLDFFSEYYYPRGGVQKLPDLLADYITENGGRIMYKTLVNEVIIKDGRACGIKTESGDVFTAPFIISNGDHRRLFTKMLPVSAVPQEYHNKLKTSEIAESMFSVFLGVDIPPEKLPVKGCQHVLYFPDYNGVEYKELFSDPDYYKRAYIMIMAPSVEDPTLAPPGKSVIILQSAAAKEFAGGWKSKDGNRGDEYKKLKEKIAADLIANAEKIIPGLSQKIEVKVTATPLTYERYTMNDGGSTGGWSKHVEKTFRRGIMGLINVATPVKNFYMVGHWSSIPGGAPIGFMTGKLVSDIVNFRLRYRK